MPDLNKIIDDLSKLTVAEAADLSKQLEEKWGVTPMAAAAPAAAAGGEAEAVEEKSEFDLHLTAIGDNKVNTIKAVREITGLGLKEAKDIVDAAPKVVKEALAKADADEAMKKLTDAGATAELK